MGSDLMDGKEEGGRRKSDDFGTSPQDNISMAASNVDMD
jgi:hypothetical protein